MINEEAREYFKSKGLNYKNIDMKSLDVLADKLVLNLEKYKLEGGFHAQQMDMKLRKRTKNDKKFDKSGLVRAKFYIDGSYFNKREGITFHEGGFIGFAGEFSTVNTQPILKAFIEWCDYLAKNKVA
ncbi:hypothetical protein [Clostridium sp. YIM B02555]|uniref:hypothetical protein n=1 Tax=Clostridium sp. YIM B02555 TaxID=2911968 RepID=UPI001EEEE4F2|nr:hypothetical protein [Clostridium sp. YIM B02555]